MNKSDREKALEDALMDFVRFDDALSYHAQGDTPLGDVWASPVYLEAIVVAKRLLANRLDD